jgi:hypothetical protein
MVSTEIRTEAPTGAVRTWWTGRYGRSLLLEVSTLLVLLSLYRLGRYLGRDQVIAAFDHAHDVVDIERWLGFANERWVQRQALDHLTLVRLLNRYYATVHFPATAAFLVVAYVKAPAVYRNVRAVLVAVTAVGLVMHIAYPLAPPRMLPGFVDTVAVYGPSVYDRPGVASVANQYAAMPSLHVGWALIVAYGTYSIWTGWKRWAGSVHAAITTIAVVITANHYWLDAVVAVALVAGALVALRRWRAPDSTSASPSYEVVTGPTGPWPTS